MAHKVLVLLAAVWAFLAVQSPLLAAELALKTSTSEKLALAQRYLSRNGVGLEKVDAQTFGLPQAPAFQGKIYMGIVPGRRRSDMTPATLLFTYSNENKNQMPDELRVGIGEKPDLSTIQPLTAEAPAPALFQRQPPQTRFANVKLNFSHGELEYPLTMDITLYAGRDNSPQYAMYQLTTVRAGKIELDTKTVKAVLIDGNGNGLFDDSGPRGQGDVLLIDANANGKLDRTPGQGHYDFGGEIFPVAPMLQIDSQYYNCVIPPSGASLTLESVQPELGSIVAGGENLKVQLLGPVYVNAASGKSETIAVPAGKYTLLQLSEKRQDKSGRKWSIEARTGGWSVSAGLEVKAGQTASLSPIGLIKVIGQIYQSGESRRHILAQFQTDQGLAITDAKIGNKRPEAPKYEIRDSNSKLITSGKLEYG
ncbi:MAG: hypothetical protein KAT11_01380 [Phycisphaerae bacterium]|nr:hypothetical protein [Phycisphaerae bacterium]